MKSVFSFFALLVVTLTVSADEKSPQMFSAEALRSDFTELYNGLSSSHVDLYVNLDAPSYDEKFESFLKRINQPMSHFQAQVLFQEFVALGRIAHARIDFPSSEYEQFRKGGGKTFPIYVSINEDTWNIYEDYSNQSLPKDAQITHINGVAVQRWFDDIAKHISSDTHEITASLLDFQLPQYIWLVEWLQNNVSDSFQLTIANNGKEQTLIVDAVSRVELQKRMDESVDNADPETSKIREYQVYDNDIGYLKPGPFYNAENPSDVWNNATFVEFIDNAFEHFLNNNVDKLIIDVRNNPGGTNSFSDPLIAWYATEPFRFASEFLVRSSKHADESNRKRLESNPSGKDSLRLAKGYEQNPYGTLFNLDLTNVEPRQDKRFEGDVFVLVDRSSYSNAVSLAAITQDYGFGKVIGEATTDFATTFASMESFTLSETGIKVGFPKAHIIRPSGDKKAGPVIPDVLLKEPGLGSALLFTSQTEPKAED